MNIKRAILSAVFVWILGVSAFIVSFLIEWMDDPELQANLALMIALIPSVILSSHFYYKKEHNTNGFKLGVILFIVAMMLDAVITVPLFIIPEGGSHLAFFTDPGFWLIAVEIILVAGLYWRFRFFNN